MTGSSIGERETLYSENMCHPGGDGERTRAATDDQSSEPVEVRLSGAETGLVARVRRRLATMFGLDGDGTDIGEGVSTVVGVEETVPPGATPVPDRGDVSAGVVGPLENDDGSEGGRKRQNREQPQSTAGD